MNRRQTIQRQGAKAQRRNVGQAVPFSDLSLAPGFSPVLTDSTSQSRFNGLADARGIRRAAKTVETVFAFQRRDTRLKPVLMRFFSFASPHLCTFALRI